MLFGLIVRVRDLAGQVPLRVFAAAVVITAACASVTHVLQIAPQSPDSVFYQAVDRSNIVVLARLVKRGVVSTSAVKPSPLTSVDSVIDVMLAPHSVTGLRRMLITVIARDTVGLDPGPYVLFGAIIAVDSTVAVREIARARVSTQADIDTIRAKVQLAVRARSDSILATHLNSADAVFIGTTTVVNPLPQPLDSGGFQLGEHSPHWNEAQIAFVNMLHPAANVSTPVIRAWVARRTDMAFLRTPQPVLDARQIFALRRAARLPAPFALGLDTMGTYFVLDSLDILPLADSARVVRLIR